jgi:uncharacterized protein (DUF433 family)
LERVVTAQSPADIGQLIVSRPDLHSGRPCLAGTGMTVHAIAARRMRGLSAEEILDQFPHLDLARIHAALAYYFLNKSRIEAELEADRNLAEELASRYPGGWTPQNDRS